MAAKSDGKVSRPKKKFSNNATKTTKNHRFESFNQRVSRLKIDPVRKGRWHHADDVDDTSITASHFKNSLLHWMELDLSDSFAAFAREVSPLCDSLPQILVNQDRILDSLLQYIEKQDALSLEPFFCLLSHLAHDLGTRFMPHLPKALSTLTAIAAQHQHVEVIEGAFSCIAWLFKYLSWLLVPDIWPIYRLLAPLLGKETKKEHVARFAAESLAFLIRKAAMLYHQDQAHLGNIVTKIFQDLESHVSEEQDAELYKHAVLTVFSEAAKGVDQGLHSSAAKLLRCLIDHAEQAVHFEIIYGFVTSLAHHADPISLAPVIELVLYFANDGGADREGVDAGEDNRVPVRHSLQPTYRPRIHLRISPLPPSHEYTLRPEASDRATMAAEMVFRIAAARKGSRVNDWSLMVKVLPALLRTIQNLPRMTDSDPLLAFQKAAVVIFASAPVGVITPYLKTIMEALMKQRGPRGFVFFCFSFGDMNQARFNELVAPYFFRYLAAHWREDESRLLVALPALVASQKNQTKLCPTAWQDHILEAFADDKTSALQTYFQSAYLEILGQLSSDARRRSRITEIIESRIAVIEPDPSSLETATSVKTQFMLGTGLKEVVKDHAKPAVVASMERSLRAFPGSVRWPFFLHNLTDLIRQGGEPWKQGVPDDIHRRLVSNLSSSSRDIRKSSLGLLDQLYSIRGNAAAHWLKSAIVVEDLPIEFQSARQGSMLIRRLSEQYRSCLKDPWLERAMVHFCFGVLSLKLSQWWDDAIGVLKVISETSTGELVVTDVAFAWLEKNAETPEESHSAVSSSHRARMVPEFQDLNVLSLEDTFEDRLNELINPQDVLLARFKSQHTIPVEICSTARSQALRVLNGLPSLVEKKSRLLVPVFLRLTASQSQQLFAMADDGQQKIDAAAPQVDGSTKPWSRRDKVALLEIFGRFQNPRVLYRTSDVLQALLSYLTRPDAEIQKLAFKAILTWKSETLRRYSQNIQNLIDESRFRDELTTLLSGGGDANELQTEHLRELMPVLLRVLYGKAITRSKTSTSSARRKAIFDAIFHLQNEYISDFVDISLGALKSVELQDPSSWGSRDHAQGRISPRTGLGLVNLLKDLTSSMGSRVAFMAQKIFGASLFCAMQANRDLNDSDSTTGTVDKSFVSVWKDIRQTGLQCITLGYEHFPAIDLDPFVPLLFAELISPRISSLPLESAHSVSGLLRLVSTWSSSVNTAHLLTRHDSSLIPAIAAILNVPSAKDDVQVFVLENIFNPIAATPGAGVDLSQAYQNSGNGLSSTHLDQILFEVGEVLAGSPNGKVLAPAIELLNQLSALVESSAQSIRLLEISCHLLDQAPRRVSPRSKGNLLKIIHHFVPLSGVRSTDNLFWNIYRSVSNLFRYFLDRENRTQLCQNMGALALIKPELAKTAELCSHLNAFSTCVIDEPDFKRRIDAFSSVATNAADFTEEQWRPLLFNLIFYIRDEDISLRTSAAHALHKYIDTRAAASSPEAVAPSGLIQDVLLHSIRTEIVDASETLRSELLSSMAHLVKAFPAWQEINDMHPLLMNGDEEASIFNNVLHIQRHRRLRALRRLAAEAGSHRLGSKNVTGFWVPLLEPFVLGRADSSADHNLASEATTTVAALAQGMRWAQVRQMLQRYSGYLRTRKELEKPALKMLAALVETVTQEAPWNCNAGEKNMSEDEDAHKLTVGPAPPSVLKESMTDREKFDGDIERGLLPPLLNYLHEKDESTVSFRTPVAVAITKLLKILLPQKFDEYLPPVLTDLCHILRSRAQESRDLTRTTLAEIARLIGSDRFGFVLKELRGALMWGYQLHVLAYTVHSILIATAEDFGPGDLDHCLPQLVTVIMGDIFGATGQEKDAEEYISRMKEVKSSKSFDSMELVAKIISISHVSHLVRPLQAILEDKMDIKMVRKIDELLRRLGVGLLQNQSTHSQSTLVFCYEVLQDARSTEPHDRTTRARNAMDRFLVVKEGTKRGIPATNRTAYAFKLVRFAIDLLRMVLQRHENLRTPASISGFLPVIGECLLSAHEEVQISTLRLLVEVVKTPLKNIKENAELYLLEAVKIVKNAVSTSTEIAQAAIKLITATIRERYEMSIRENDLAYLIKRVKSDLEEPDRQGVMFNFIKAVLQRKIVITEVYEVMDAIAGIMITSPAEATRNVARSLYFSFLLNYPQARSRLTKQLVFLVKNLEYRHVEGRQSVMEAIYLLLGRVGADVVQDMIGTFFLPLVMVTVNDDSLECRKMAGSLLQTLFERADEDKSRQMLNMLQSWLEDEQPLVTQMALHVHGILLDIESKAVRKHIPLLHQRIRRTLQVVSAVKSTTEWESIYYALQAMAKLCDIEPASALHLSQSSVWDSAQAALRYPHAWVKVAASQLFEKYLADFLGAKAGAPGSTFPLKGTHGLLLHVEDLERITRASFAALRVRGVSEELAAQLIRSLVLVGQLGGDQRMDSSTLGGTAGESDVSDPEAPETPSGSSVRQSLLQYSLSRISFILRCEPVTTRAASLVPKTAVIQLLAAWCSHLPAATLTPCVPTILLPLHHLTDPSIPAPFSTDEGFNDASRALVATAQEVMALLQDKLDTQEYVRELASVRERVKARREGRRVKRRVEAVADPEKVGREKRRKEERKKVKRREMNVERREWRRAKA